MRARAVVGMRPGLGGRLRRSVRRSPGFLVQAAQPRSPSRVVLTGHFAQDGGGDMLDDGVERVASGGVHRPRRWDRAGGKGSVAAGRGRGPVRPGPVTANPKRSCPVREPPGRLASTRMPRPGCQENLFSRRSRRCPAPREERVGHRAIAPTCVRDVCQRLSRRYGIPRGPGGNAVIPRNNSAVPVRSERCQTPSPADSGTPDLVHL